MKNLRRIFRYQIPAIIWAMLIFFQSSISDLTAPSFGISFQDKIAHAVVFGILGYLLTRALYNNTSDTLKKYAMLLSISFGLLYAISDEVHQSFVPGRDPDVSDVIADFLGIILAQLFFVYKKRFA